MRSFKSLNPLKSQSYSSLPVHEKRWRRSQRDTEKHGYSDRDSFDADDDEDYDSPLSPQSESGSSRHTSGSFSAKPMLKKRSAAGLARDIRYRLPRRIVKAACYSLMLFVVGFILFLIRMSHISTESLSDRRPVFKPQWESFEFLTRYYGGVRTLAPFSERNPESPMEESNITLNEGEVRQLPPSEPFDAYSHLTSAQYLADHIQVEECFLDQKKTRIPSLQYYEGRPSGLLENVMGSYDLLGLRQDICFERYGRLGPYGHGYGHRLGGAGSGQFGDNEGSESVWKDVEKVDFRKVDWADAQKRCFESNAARFSSDSKSALTATENSTEVQKVKSTLPRTAVVIRTWDNYEYREEDIMYLRAMITELSLGSGGEYDVHLLVQVKNTTVSVWADDTIYRDHLQYSVPKEFWGIATLWSESQNAMFYPGLEDNFPRGADLPVHGVYRGLLMALQTFAINNQEYEFFWQWEMDVRYTGHYYDLFSKFSSWSKSQPRKGLWERNGRFYIPSVHGTWDEFTHMVRVQTESGTNTANNVWSGIDGSKASSGEKAIWGPERPSDSSDHFEIEKDVLPETTHTADKHEWGVGEDADLITLNPIFDPEGSGWGLANDITGYNITSGTGSVPRRAAIITASRLSRNLLTTMHRETAFAHHHAFPEMWPATVSLHHGYKAVYVPHPTYVDRAWPINYLAATMNGGRNGATGGSRMSVFGGEREHNLLGTTWYYNAGFAGNLWKRWLGLKVDNEGGEQFETEGKGIVDGLKGVPGMKGGEGRMCLPGMLLHPVKGVEIPVEAGSDEVVEPEFGPDD